MASWARLAPESAFVIGDRVGLVDHEAVALGGFPIGVEASHRIRCVGRGWCCLLGHRRMDANDSGPVGLRVPRIFGSHSR
jgi:hypothetical protein